MEVVAVGHRREGLAYDVAHALVASGVLTATAVRQIWAMLQLLVSVLDEITAAMTAGWDPHAGEPRPREALEAALVRLASSAAPDRLLALREDPRCGVPMKIAQAPCIRPRGHAGAHRASAP